MLRHGMFLFDEQLVVFVAGRVDVVDNERGAQR
jgi:hypothetical protein